MWEAVTHRTAMRALDTRSFGRFSKCQLYFSKSLALNNCAEHVITWQRRKRRSRKAKET